MKNLNKTSFLMLLVLLSGNVFAESEEDVIAKERILNKLAFAYQCDQSGVVFQCLNQNKRRQDECAEFGVLACGQKIVYTQIANTWIATAIKQESMKGAANQNLQGDIIVSVASESIAAKAASSAAAQIAATSAASASAAAASAAAASAAAAGAAAAASATAAAPAAI